MPDWILVPCLVSLRGEFDKLSPTRDKGADGSIGDAAHQQESSDHNPDETGKTPFEDADNINEVHAIDIDSTGPWPSGKDLDSRVEIIRARHKSGADTRLQNIIWRGRVASRSWGWTWQDRPTIGHFDHAHFSARYTTAQESDTSPWGVYEEDDVSVGDVRDGLFQLTAESAERNTPTGRQMGNNLNTIIQGAVTPLLKPLTAALTAALNDGDKAEILAAIANVDEQVVAKLGGQGLTAAEKVALLRPLLGDDAAAVGALLQQ